MQIRLINKNQVNEVFRKLESFYIEKIRVLMIGYDINIFLSIIFILVNHAFRFQLSINTQVIKDLESQDYLISNLNRFQLLLPNASYRNIIFYFSLSVNSTLIIYLLAQSFVYMITQKKTSDVEEERLQQLKNYEKTFSFFYQSYNYIFLIPFSYFSSESSSDKSILWLLNFIFTMLISYICCLNIYEHAYATKNKISKRYSYFTYLIALIEILNAVFNSILNYKIIVYVNIAMNLATCLDIIYELPYYTQILQKINMYCCIFNFLSSVIFTFNVYIDVGRDLSLLLCLICIIPISIKVGNLIYRSLINQAEYQLLQSINNPDFECRNPNFIDIYLRKLYEKTQFNFKFSHFFNDPETCLTLSALISSESIEDNIEDEKEDYIGLSRQTFIVQEFFRDLYKQILKARQKIDKKANIKYCYMSFLIQVYKKRTIAYLEILNEKNDKTRQKSLREKQSLYSILQQAEESFKYEAFMNDHINVLQIIDYDRELKNNQFLLEDCIKNKKLLLNDMSNNIMDLNQFFKKATQLIQQRKLLKAKLHQSCAINDENSNLKEQIQSYIYFLSMGDVKLKNFYQKSSQSNQQQINNQQNTGQNQAAPKIQMYRSERFSIVFITLVKNIGTITGASNNLGTLFDYQNHEMIGKNINIIIPSNISTKHQQILNNFSKRGSNNHCFQNFRFILGQNKKGFIIPLMLKLKIDIVGKDDFGISGIFRRVSEKQNFMMISEAFNISGISESIYKEVFSQYFTLSEVQQFNVNKLIPLFLGTVTIKNEEDVAYSNNQDEIFESFLIVNYSKQARQILFQKTFSIENDIQQIQLSTSNIYKIVFQLQSHFSYGFRYYNLIINSFSKIKQLSEEYASACSTLVQQLDEIYQTPRQILLNLMDQCLNLKYDDEVSIEKMITNKLAEQNSVFLPLDESNQVQINQIPSKKEIESNFNPFNQIQKSINNISDDQNDQKPDNNLQMPQINHCESLKQIQTNNDDNIQLTQVSKENNNSNSQQVQNYVRHKNELNLRKQKKNLTFADNFTNNYILKRKKSNNTINEEPVEEQESFAQTTKSNKTSGTQSKSQNSQSQVLQKIQETKLALEQNDIYQQQMYQSAGNKRLQQFAQKLKFSLQNSKNKQSPKLKKSPLSPEKVIQILQLNKKSSSNEFQSPLQNQRGIKFQRKNQRKGLIRLLTSRMQDKENVVSESDSSNNSAKSKTKKNTIIDQSTDQHKRNHMHKHTFVSIQKKSSSEIDQISPFSNSPLSSFRQGKQRTIMLKSIQNLLQQQFQNIQKQEDNNEENGQQSNSQDLDIKQAPLTSDREQSQKNFAIFEKDDKEDMLKSYRKNLNSQQEINNLNENGKIKIKLGNIVQQSEKSFKEDMIKSKISSLDFLKNSKIESGTKISKKGSTLMISKNTEMNHMSKYSFEKAQEMQSKNTKFDVYDYDFSSSSSESSGSLKNQNHNETSKLIQQQTQNLQTNLAILDSRQDIKNPLQTANNIFSGSNIAGNIGQFNSAQVIEKLRNDLKISNQTKQQLQKKKKNKIDIKQNIDEDEETSSQSEQKKRNLIFQKLIMHQINKYQRDLIISAIKILGFLVLLGIALGTFIIYLDINNQFGKMKKNIDYLGWPMSVKSQIILVLKGEVLLRYLKNNIFNYEQQDIDQYSQIAQHQLQQNYKLLQNLITDQLGKDINEYLIFRDIVNTQVDYTFQNSINTLPYQYNATMFLQYNIDFINSFLFRISNMLPDRENDESNIFLNYLKSLDALDIINNNSLNNENDIKSYLDFQLYFGLFAMITISLFFAISVFPLYAIISSYSQKVLKIFSTFSHDLLTQMHTHLNQFSKHIKKNKKLLTHHQQQNILLFETMRIEKKRNISDTTDLPKLKIFHILFSISCFLMIIVYPLLNFFLCQAFVNEQHQNLNLLQILFYTKSLSIENIELNYLISYKKMMPNEYSSFNVTQFEMRGNVLIDKNTQDIDQLQIIVKQQHQFIRRNQDEFYNFVLAILEGNACNVINQNSRYFNNQSDLTYSNCLQIRNGIFTRGLLLSISDTFGIMPIVASLYKINDPILYKQLLNAYQKTTSLVDLDNYNVGLSIFIDACKNFILDISQSYFSYMYTVQLALICYQIILLLLIFYFGWSYFCSNLQNQLYSSKQLFSLFHISFLIENPYFYSYFSSRKFKI
ncbi:bowman-birk serine protease inhibitor family protein (macronuclear) [Tetrahymena thermophila SB210]|uniref:Bowman-birk serine protease inhibitor family protein n=1 Tax=Tetrahymena thermophila (strain SB210) TaxID=312017 RepID=W7X964_TETTS|nr:bowman-birk serine protease inhibitor family protein [Tetrahymena thermophila SB210]EWS73882.1 bowman-birk serine protease inhibitor family protein [Tetrahymena thermophila SB210]|eukprot:XP_012653629.1 bowman-birk serine protease inhibitor family protein [Tetrahymena thermophila SB210]